MGVLSAVVVSLLLILFSRQDNHGRRFFQARCTCNLISFSLVALPCPNLEPVREREQSFAAAARTTTADRPRDRQEAARHDVAELRNSSNWPDAAGVHCHLSGGLRLGRCVQPASDLLLLLLLPARVASPVVVVVAVSRGRRQSKRVATLAIDHMYSTPSNS